MLNSHYLRQAFNNERIIAQKHARRACIGLILAGLAIGLVLFKGCTLAHAEITEDKAIKAIIGEAESEPYAGKLALARSLRVRGTLKGVYGINAPRVRAMRYSNKTYQEAKRAWKESKDLKGWTASGWGNKEDVKKFKQTAWFKKCVIVAKIGQHYFYRKA